MVENWIDVNKIQDGTDSALCWAATCTNALTYTGWSNRDPFELYDDIRRERKNEGNGLFRGLVFCFHLLKIKICYSEYTRILPTSFLNACGNLEEKNACLLLSIATDGESTGHALTAYRSVFDKTRRQDDIRSLKQFLCVDSDDSDSGNRFTVRTFRLNMTYNIEKKRMETDYILNGDRAYIRYAVLLLPEQNPLWPYI